MSFFSCVIVSMSSPATSFLSAGYYDSGQLCHSSDNMIPSHVTDLNTANLISVSFGCRHCAAVYSDGTVFGWGYNGGGRIGLPFDETVIRTPTRINGLPSIMKVKCGRYFTLFLSQDNDVFIATSNKNREKLIEKVTTSGRCVSVFGFRYPWIVCKDNSLYRITNQDELGVKKTTKFELPKTAKSKEIKAIISPSSCSADIFLTELGEIFGLCEMANKSKKFVEFKSLKNQRIKKVSGIKNHIVALTEDGKVFVWGNNYYGQLGLGNKEDQKKQRNFVEIPKFSNFKIVDVSAGARLSVFVDTRGNVWATGDGYNGKTLFGDEKERHSPERINSIDKAVAVSCGWNFTFVQIGGSPIFDLNQPQKRKQIAKIFVVILVVILLLGYLFEELECPLNDDLLDQFDDTKGYLSQRHWNEILTVIHNKDSAMKNFNNSI